MAKKDIEEGGEVATKTEAAQSKFIKVQANTKDGRVALWERDSRHPGGEVFVSGAAVVEVARTSAVRKALADGRLVEV